MCRFTLESTPFIFNKCPIYTHDGASAKFSTYSHETDYSAGYKTLGMGHLVVFLPCGALWGGDPLYVRHWDHPWWFVSLTEHTPRYTQFSPVAKCLVPDWGDIVDSGIRLSYHTGPPGYIWLAGRYDNPMPESTKSTMSIYPRQGLRIWLLILFSYDVCTVL